MLSQQLRVLVAQWLRASIGDSVTTEALAGRAGISRATISRILNCSTDADDDTVSALAAALGVSAPVLALTQASDPATALRRMAVDLERIARDYPTEPRATTAAEAEQLRQDALEPEPGQQEEAKPAKHGRGGKR